MGSFRETEGRQDSGAPEVRQAVRFPDPLVRGRLVRRYKRFLVDVELDDGRAVTAHCVNTGSMAGCAPPGAPVWISPARNTARKLPWTWEIVDVGTSLVGVHTARANDLAELAVRAGQIPGLSGYTTVRREMRYGESSRCDLCLLDDTRPPCWVEVKNVTLVEGSTALFPDAVTARGTRHLGELTAQVAAGCRAAMLYVVQRTDAEAVAPADRVDPAYGHALRRAAAGGVELYAIQVRPTPEGLVIERCLPVTTPMLKHGTNA